MAVFGVLILSQAALIGAFGLKDNINKASLEVVFGNEVKEDGTLSDRLKARLEKAEAIYKSGLTDRILVSGGIGKSGFDEAQKMREFLVSDGIPAANILLDNKGVNTWASAQNTAKIMQTEHWDSVILVSQFFHLARAKLAFEQVGIKEIYTASANYWEWRDIYSLFREVFAYDAYLLKS